MFFSLRLRWAHGFIVVRLTSGGRGEDAAGQIASLRDSNRPLAAFGLLEKAEGYLPSDPQLKKIADETTMSTSITSSPAGATVEIQDYASPDSSWHTLGVTPLKDTRVPKGYFRWKVGKAGHGGDG